MLKKALIMGAVGAGVVYLSAQANTYLNKPGSDGKKPLGDSVGQYAPYIGGGVALAVISHFVHVG